MKRAVRVRMHSLGRWAALVVTTLSVVAVGQDRIAVVAIEGTGGAKVRAQLLKTLCRSNTCVQPGRGGKKVSVDAVIGGTVKGAGAKRALELLVYTSEDERAVRRKLPIDRKGLLSKRGLAVAAAAVKSSLTDEGEAPSLTAVSETSPQG